MSQETLINSTAERIRCVAGPGTGKTWSIQKRVECLLNSGQVDGSKILAVTFTRQAAAQLKNDLCGLETTGAESIVASTLHSHAFKILGHEQAIEALGRSPRPCLESELIPFRHDLAIEFGSIKKVKEKLEAFEAMWARLQNEETGWPESLEDQDFSRIYLEWMRFHRGMTVGELISLAVQFLRNNPVNDACEDFEHIIVDEYQDLNKADQTLIELIGDKSKIIIVGDDDQSIYAFRYAHPDGIREWYDIQSDPKEDVILNVCRRCDGKILALANSLISNNPHRLRGDLLPMAGREKAGDVHIVQWVTRHKETEGIAEAIKKLLESGAIPQDEDILVLVPRKGFGQKLLEKLVESGVEDVEFNAGLDWSNTELGQRMALLTLVDNRDDLVALRYWLGVGHTNWRRNEYSRLYQYCREKSLTPPEVLGSEEICKELRVAGLKARWDHLLERLDRLSTMSEDELLDELLPSEGVTQKIGEILRTLRESNPEEPLKKLVIDAVLSPYEDRSESKVNIMTYWGAKGVTSHTVIITGLVNGLLPTDPNPGIAGLATLEEQRRLMFVTITRAKKRLIMSSFRRVSRTENSQLKLGLSGNGQWLSTQASRFFLEMGSHMVTAENGDQWLDSLGSPRPLWDCGFSLFSYIELTLEYYWIEIRQIF